MGYLQFGRHSVKQIIRFKDAVNDSVVVNPLLYASQGLRYNRKLQVILTTDIDKLGKAGETVKVAPGYFRNHLMPKLLAVPNIDKFAYLLTEQRKIYQPIEEVKQEDVVIVTESKEDMMKEFEKAALRLDKAKLMIASHLLPFVEEFAIAKMQMNFSETGPVIELVLRRLIDVQKAKARESKGDPLELRIPVSKKALVAEVARQLCVNITPDNLHLPSPLSTIGEYEVPLRLPRSIPLPEGKLNWTLKVKIRKTSLREEKAQKRATKLETENISLSAEMKAYKGNYFGDPQSLLERICELKFENASLRVDLKAFHDYKYTDFQWYRQRTYELESENASLKTKMAAYEVARVEFGDPQTLFEQLDACIDHSLGMIPESFDNALEQVELLYKKSLSREKFNYKYCVENGREKFSEYSFISQIYFYAKK
ncbi:50S ribosomal protein l9-like [Trifolium pratense]|uniref:Large ribosomal subunit protein bL9c n=1 Tax=Trifolium pratense TaxID=57577 RepID=A0A2K3NVJ8_TRIPR|nr:50S ribosomal protein l9-like [Trifolium pratense]